MKKSVSVTAWTSFPHLEFAEELSEYMQIRPRGHGGYYHYTSLKAIDGILGNGFCLSSVDRFNDEQEKEVFKGSEKKYYSLCFSTGVQENLALWYLYSGVDGNGGRLQFTYRAVGKMMRSAFTLVEYDYKAHTPIKEIAVLRSGENAIFRLEDVLYEGDSKKKGFVDIKYNTMTNRGNFTTEECNRFALQHKGFQKQQIWYYEKETRLLVELAEDLYQSLDPTKDYGVILKIPEDVLRYTKICFAPKIESLDYIESTTYSNIKKHKSRLRLSDHRGKVKIDPCRNCEWRNRDR